MILGDFTTVEKNRNNQNRKHHYKQTNVVSVQRLSSQPSSLGRCIDNNINSKKKSQSNSCNNTNIIDIYISELNIPGVKQAYYNSQQYIQNQNLLHQTMLDEKQKYLNQSIQRLYSTGFSWKRNKRQQHQPQQHNQQQQCESKSKDNSPQDNNNQKQKQCYYNQLYKLDGRFDHQFRVRKLELECKQLEKKLMEKFIGKYRIWVADNEKDKTNKEYKQHSLKPSHPRAKMTVIIKSTVQQMFVKSVITFLLTYTTKPSTTFLSPQDQLTISYSDFLNHHKRQFWVNPTLNSSIPYDIQLSRRLKQLSQSLSFVYYFLSFDRLQSQGGDKLRNVSQLEMKVLEWLKKGQYQWEKIYKVFQRKLQPKFTVPFQNKLYQVKTMSKKGNKQNKQQEEEQIQTFQPFKANPIPQSTYQKPQSPSIQTKKPPTQPQPFNFTHHPSFPSKTANDYYQQDRNFKANSIPKTLYQPQIIGLSQKQRQLLTTQHKQKLYHKAKYPKTMSYLENFNQYQQDKKKQLRQKYTRDRKQQGKNKPKQIPDFQRLHKKDLKLLQARKQMNRANTEPKPFKFTQPKSGHPPITLKTTLITNSIQFSQLQTKSKPISQSSPPIPAAKTTAKFSAYVQLRRQQKQQKQKQKQQREIYRKRQEEDKRRYKNILKQRMRNELQQQPKVMRYQNNINMTADNMVKVDLQEIYAERPLLMAGGGQQNNKTKNNYDNRTCFTDNYQPII